MALFGSYLTTDKPKLGNIDVGVELGPKERNRDLHSELNIRQMREARGARNLRGCSTRR